MERDWKKLKGKGGGGGGGRCLVIFNFLLFLSFSLFNRVVLRAQ
jgi:hypothetical protein